jgi:PTS system cellobiose-specific IIB component
MKIMLVCAGGMSTSILMKKMEKFGVEKGVDLDIKAFAVQDLEENYKSYDVILLGPQISYKFNDIKKSVTTPVGVIQSYDYAVGNVENIMRLVQSILK